MKQQHVITTALVLLICAGGLYAAADDSAGHLSGADAVSKAIRIMGLDSLKEWDRSAADSSPEIVTIVDSTTPFLQLDNRKAYKVVLSNVPIAFDKGEHGDRIVNARDFDVYIDPESGVVLKVVSTLPTYEAKVISGEIRKPTREQAERQLASSHETYIDFISEDPSPHFLEALKEVATCQHADQIVGRYIELQRVGRHKAWVIETFGVVFWWDGEIYDRNHLRIVVDETGLRFGTNIPCAVD